MTDGTWSLRIEPIPEAGCWIWTGAVRGRYGLIGSRAAHRVVYESHHGPIPSSHHLHHLCRVTLCVNPDHLVPLTATDHSRAHRRRQRAPRVGVRRPAGAVLAAAAAEVEMAERSRLEAAKTRYARALREGVS